MSEIVLSLRWLADDGLQHRTSGLTHLVTLPLRLLTVVDRLRCPKVLPFIGVLQPW